MILADENIHSLIIEALREAGYDVIQLVRHQKVLKMNRLFN